jgi:hypothetical protein
MEEELALLREQIKQLQLAATKSTSELHLRKQIEELSNVVRKYKHESIDAILNRCTTIVHQTFNSSPNYCGIELFDDLDQRLILRSASNLIDAHTNKISLPIVSERKSLIQDSKLWIQKIIDPKIAYIHSKIIIRLKYVMIFIYDT